MTSPLIPLATPKTAPTRHGQIVGYGRKILDPPETSATVVCLFFSSGKSLTKPHQWCHGDKEQETFTRHHLNLVKVDINRQADKPNTRAEGFPML